MDVVIFTVHVKRVFTQETFNNQKMSQMAPFNVEEVTLVVAQVLAELFLKS